MFQLFARHVVRGIRHAHIDAGEAYEQKLIATGLYNRFSKPAIDQTKASVAVFLNEHYLGDTTPSIDRVLTHTMGISMAGDKEGKCQDGTAFPDIPGFFSSLEAGDPRGLAPIERIAAGKKIIASNSLAMAYGGYPHHQPRVNYEHPMNVGIFSLAGAQFEMSYLHYRLFMLDPFQTSIEKPLLSHLHHGLPRSYSEATDILNHNAYFVGLSNLRLGFSFLSRKQNGNFYSSFRQKNAVIFLENAFKRHMYEDVALLLAAVNESARHAGKPAYLKATAVGMGFFARVDCVFDIKHHLYPYYLAAFHDLLKTGAYPHISTVEFPIFSRMLDTLHETTFPEKRVGGVTIEFSHRDVLDFHESEREKYYPCVVNPSDANALPGNEWGDGSVESTIANNTTLRADQVYLVNPLVLDPAHHHSVHIDLLDFKTSIEPRGHLTTLKI
ncbi:MAG: DUF4804 domain-containing protein [Legionellales bacterium]|nr:DUF4804 domain-containing protein [Legionellales bacterium]